MSLFGSVNDVLTGGKNGDASDALKKALQAYQDVKVPSIADLSLPELEKYVQAGLVTPAQAQAVLQGKNAYDDASTDPRAREASIAALNKLQEVGDSGGMDATARAGLEGAESGLNRTMQGQRGSILDQMAQRGTPTSLMGPAAELAFAGQDAEQAHKDAVQSNSDANLRALQAVEASGSLGNQIEGQQFSEASTKAAAANAINQWNAANATTVNLNNASQRQQADLYNNQNAQAVGNANTTTGNKRTEYNAQVPQTVFDDSMKRAGGMAGVYGDQAKQATKEGEQVAGTAGAMIGAASNGAGSYLMGSHGAPSGAPAAAGPSMADLGPVMMASHGGIVPGHPATHGDSPANDKVPALLSPGEAVIPRSAAHDPQTAAAFVKHLHRQTAQRPVHPDDIKGVLHALTSIRSGGI